MVSKRQGIYGYISVAALISGILVGCGGSSASVQGIGAQIKTTGTVPNQSGSSTSGVSSSGAPQQVQVTSGGSTVTGTLPPGESIPAGGSVCVITNADPIIQGLTVGPKFNKVKVTPMDGTPGEVDVDGQNTGLTVTASGNLSGILILTPGNHKITAWGPFNILSGITSQLTVQQFNFGVVVKSDGIGSSPSSLVMQLPGNGGSWANGNYVTVGYPTPDFAAGSGTLTIVVDSARTISQKKLVQSGMATFKSFQTYKVGAQIPQNGIISVNYNYTP